MGVTAPGFSNRKALRIVLTAVALSVVAAPVAVALFVHSGADHSWTDDSLNGFGMWGVFVVYLWTRPPRKESLLIVAAAALVRAIHWFAVAEHPYPGCSVIGVGVYLPFFCIPPLAYRAFKGPKDSVYRLSLSGVLLFSYIGIVLGFYVSLIKLLCQFKLDNFLYAFDGALGSHFNFAIGQIALKSQLLGSVLTAVYNSLGFWMALLFAAHASIKNNKVDILKLTISNPVIGFALYFLYPAAGPKYAFPSFPQLPGHVPLAPALISGIPNAMPSLHVATALLLFYLARPWKWLRILTGIFLAATVVSVFSTGEHYIVDAVVAIPYSLMILAFASKSPSRKAVLISNAAVLGIWLVVLRFGAFLPATSVGLALVTIAMGLQVERRYSATLYGDAAGRGVTDGLQPSLPDGRGSVDFAEIRG